MKKLRLRKWCKYTLVGIANAIVLLNLPLIFKEAITLNDYRYNILVLGAIILSNMFAVMMIEN